jgi:hypothetical protein
MGCMENTTPQTRTPRRRPHRGRSSYNFTAAGLVRLDSTTLLSFRDALTGEVERVDAALCLRSAELQRETAR